LVFKVIIKVFGKTKTQKKTELRNLKPLEQCESSSFASLISLVFFLQKKIQLTAFFIRVKASSILFVSSFFSSGLQFSNDDSNKAMNKFSTY